MLSQEKKRRFLPFLLAPPSRNQYVQRIAGNYFKISISSRLFLLWRTKEPFFRTDQHMVPIIEIPYYPYYLFTRRLDRTVLSLFLPLPPSALRIRRLNAKKRRRYPRQPPGLLASGQSWAFVVSPPGSDGYGLFKRISRSLGASFCSAAQALPPFECLFVSLPFYRRANDSSARCRGPSRERRVDERQCAPRSSGSKETKKGRKREGESSVKGLTGVVHTPPQRFQVQKLKDWRQKHW